MITAMGYHMKAAITIIMKMGYLRASVAKLLNLL
jgi:hypothetical protein